MSYNIRLGNRVFTFMLYAYPIFYTGGLVAAFWRMERLSDKIDRSTPDQPRNESLK